MLVALVTLVLHRLPWRQTSETVSSPQQADTVAQLYAPVLDETNQNGSAFPFPTDFLSTRQKKIEAAAGDMAEEVFQSLTGKYLNKRPKKVHSSLVLALETTHRRRIVLHPLAEHLTPAEFKRARGLLDEKKPCFDELLQRRLAIMKITERSVIPELLDYNDIAIQLLSRKLRDEIYVQVVQATRRAERRRKRALAQKTEMAHQGGQHK